MLFHRIAITAAVALAPVPASAQDLVDLARWNEAALPGAPFRIDVPMPLEVQPDRVIETTTIHGWKTNYGLMSIEIGFTDRASSTSFSARDNLEQLAGGLIKEWNTPTANLVADVSDLTVVGYPAAKLEIERTLDSGRRIRTERLLIRVGNDDDWTVQTTRFVEQNEDLDSAHIFESIQAPSPAPVRTPARVGRMSITGFGEHVITADPLEGDAAATYEKWVTHAFAQGKTKAWIYNIRVTPGNVFDASSAAQMLADSVISQSNPQPSIYPFPTEVAGLQGSVARGQANTTEGEECFRILAVGDGQEGWAMLLAGPNTARSETMFREMIDSIQIAAE